MAAPMTASQSSPEQDRAQSRIARMIRAYMAAAGERQADLAAVLNVDQTQVSRILAGRRKLTVDELEVIAIHYGRHPGAFFEGFDGEAHQNRKRMTGADLRLVAGAVEDPRPGPGQMELPLGPRLTVVRG